MASNHNSHKKLATSCMLMLALAAPLPSITASTTALSPFVLTSYADTASPSSLVKEQVEESTEETKEAVKEETEEDVEETEAEEAKTYYGFSVAHKSSARRARSRAAATTATGDEVVFHVTYDAQGGEITGVPSDYHPTGTAIGKLPTATMKGFKFLGWYTEPDGKGGEQVTEDTIPTQDVTYYAHWESINYIVIFLPNGGEGKMTGSEIITHKNDDESIIYYQMFILDESGKLSKNTYTRDGYDFLGWAKSPYATTPDLQDEASILNYDNAVADDAIPLYAVWKKQSSSYTVTFDPNGGEGTLSGDDIKTKTDGDNTSYYIEVEEDETANLPKNTFTKDGYEFLGWAKSPDATTPDYKDTAEIKNIANKGENVTLYAVWKKKDFSKFNIHAEVSGNMAKLNKTVGVQLLVAQDNSFLPSSDEYHYVDQDNVTHSFTFHKGGASFDMKDGDTFTFMDLPTDYEYKVYVSDADFNSEYEIRFTDETGTVNNDRTSTGLYATGTLSTTGTTVTVQEILDGTVPTGVSLPNASIPALLSSFLGMMYLALRKTRLHI